MCYLNIGGRASTHLPSCDADPTQLCTAATDRTSRVTVGHAEGMPLAFANIYSDLAEAIHAQKEGRPIDPAANLYPRAEDGLRSMAAVHNCVESASQDGKWVDARPPMFR